MCSRELNGEILTLGASGWTYDNSFVLYDRETESLWYSFCGIEECGFRGIAGPYAEQILLSISASGTTWEDWKTIHPDTKIMTDWFIY